MKVFRYLWAIYFLVCFTIVFLLLYPVFWLLLRNEKHFPKAHSLRRYWGKLLILVTGLNGKTYYEEALDSKATFIFTPNHYSYLDILTVNTLMPFYFNFMAKQELAKIPLFKIFFKDLDIPVNRKNRVEAAKSYNKGIERLKNGVSLLIFPEGGITTDEPSLSKFKLGAFKMAIETKTPIVPISLPDNYDRLPSRGLLNGGSPGKMRMFVHKPIHTNTMTEKDAPQLAQTVYEILDQKLKELARENNR
jgi:1-acyl-sn-glycerol-3-phosphate acyltransferase